MKGMRKYGFIKPKSIWKTKGTKREKNSTYLISNISASNNSNISVNDIYAVQIKK